MKLSLPAPLPVKQYRPAAAVVLALGLLTTATACTSSAVATEGTLEVGQLGTAQVTEALLEASGQDNGMDYSVNWSLHAAGPAFMEAVPSGSVDVASMADTPPIFAQAGKIPAKIVGVQQTMAAGESFVEVVVAGDSPIKTVSDLKGKTVASAQATIMQYTLLAALQKEGLSYDDVKVINLPPTDALAAFQRGDVDAVAALDPQLAQLKAAGARTVADGVDTTSGYGVFVATDKALADPQKEKWIGDFIQRISKAEEWADTHPDEWAPIYAEKTGLDPAVARSVLDRQDHRLLTIDQTVIDNQQKQTDAFTELDLIPGLDASQQFDTRYNQLFEENK